MTFSEGCLEWEVGGGSGASSRVKFYDCYVPVSLADILTREPANLVTLTFGGNVTKILQRLHAPNRPGSAAATADCRSPKGKVSIDLIENVNPKVYFLIHTQKNPPKHSASLASLDMN